MRRAPPNATDPVTLRLQKATALHRAGKLDAASAEYRRVLKRVPGHPLAISGRAMVAYARGKTALALDTLMQVAPTLQSDPGFLMNLGTVQTANEQWDVAEASFRQAIALQPDYADPYYNLGDLYLRQARPDAAIAVFDECMAARGRDFHALAYKAHALIDAGETAAANQLLDYEGLVQKFEFADRVEPLSEFNTRIANWLENHPTLTINAMSTRRGRHTGDLTKENTPPWREIEQLIRAAVSWYAQTIEVPDEHPMRHWRPRAWSPTAWGVVMHDGGHERTHIHPNGWLSGVLYLRLPELIEAPERRPEGWLEFGQPTPELHVTQAPKLWHHQPRYGEMVLFPSYFYHGTVPFKGDETRVCLSFDIEPIKT
ncbi:MAG: putative 2OG-Fe(II) oxygenase [Pseudomonadales bacterium]